MTAPAPAGAAAPRRRVPPLAWALIAVMALEIAARIGFGAGPRVAGWLAMGCVVLLAARLYGLRERYLLTLCALLAAAIWQLRPDGAGVLAAALDQAGFLMAFVLLLGLLQEAAATSPAIEAAGRFLTRQPPARRYQALSVGSAALSVLFNIGTLSFLVPLVRRGIKAATPGDALNPVRERRQLGAVQRGFAWAVVWSPTAIAPLAVMELIPGISRGRWSLLGLGVFGAMLALGAAEDRLRFRRLRPAAPRASPTVPWRAAGRLALACLWLFGMAAAVVAATGDTVIFGLMVACPLMLVGWLGVQHMGAPAPWRRTAARLGLIAREGLPRSAAIAVTLAASGFVGVAAAALVPVERLAALLRLEALPDFVLLSLLPPVIVALSLLAVSPIMLAVFFGSLFGALPVLPADPTLLALSISCGWALTMTLSPFATVVLLIERLGGIPGRTLTWGWHAAFSLLAAAALVPIFAALTGGR